MSVETIDRPVSLVSLHPYGNEGLPAWLIPMRASAHARFLELGIPTTKHEEWKYTSLREFESQSFAEPTFANLSDDDIADAVRGLEDAQRIVFVNGIYSEPLTTRLSQEEGVEIRTLQCVGGDPSNKLKNLFGTVARTDEFAFANLNSSQFRSGAYVQIHRNTKAERPIHLLFISTGGTASYPRVLVHAEQGSEATVVESYVTVGEGTSFVCGVTEVVVEANAKLEHVKLQSESERSYHIALSEARVEGDGTYLDYNVTFGGKLTRNDRQVFIGGSNAHVRMDGVYVADGEQHCDNHTRLDHAFPHCDSFEVYKGVLDGASSGVFNGKIFVYLDAQKTDAKQTNQALLLSPKATIETKPQLEIFADDVKCTHGATVGQLREDALFYLQSRGIPLKQARALLVYAFAAEVLERISHDGLRSELESRLYQKLGTDQG